MPTQALQCYGSGEFLAAMAFADNQPVWRFGAMAMERSRALSPALLADELSTADGICKFSITPVRN